MLNIQKYLLDHSFGELSRAHDVACSFSNDGIRFVLNYDILAQTDNIISNECRGLVLANVDNKKFLNYRPKYKKEYDHICPGETKIVAFGFRRFLNFGQPNAAVINWNDPQLRCFEKLDGTCVFCYYFNGKWHTSTRNTTDADILLDNGIFTFRSLFEKAVQETTGLLFNDFTKKLNTRYTYVFELTSPYSVVVVRHPHTRITLLTVRDLNSLNEIPLDNLTKWAKSIDLPIVEHHPINNINDAITFVNSRKGNENEGIVVMDSNFNRIKIKHPDYNFLNRTKDHITASDRNCLELILNGKEDDIIPFLPEEVVLKILNMKNKLKSFIDFNNQEFSKIKEQSDSRKSFAFIVGGRKDIWDGPLFAMYSGHINNVQEFIMRKKIDDKFGDTVLDKILSFIK